MKVSSFPEGANIEKKGENERPRAARGKKKKGGRRESMIVILGPIRCRSWCRG